MKVIFTFPPVDASHAILLPQENSGQIFFEQTLYLYVNMTIQLNTWTGICIVDISIF